MRASNFIVAAVAPICVLALFGCQSSAVATLPNGELRNTAGAQIDASGAKTSGVYRTWVNFHKLGLTQVRFSIEPPSSNRPSYIVVFPFPYYDAQPHLKASYYRARVVLTMYSPAPGGAAVAGRAKLAHDLGTFEFRGRLGPSFKMHFTDRRGSGTLTASYVNPTHPSAFTGPESESVVRASPPWPTPPPMIDYWRSTPGAVSGVQPPVQFMDIEAAQVVLGGGGPGWQVHFNGGAYGLPPTSLTPAVNGVWTQNPCTADCAAGDWQATAFMDNGVEWVYGTTAWAPPNSDSTDGSWQTFVNDGAPYGNGTGLLVEQCSYCASALKLIP